MRIAVWLATLGFLISCASGVRPFPRQPPLWKDVGDFRTFSKEPEEHKASTIWDGVDEILFRPIPNVFKVDPPKRAPNVNALDEVPDSSWFTNRMGRKALSLDEIAKGACTKPIEPAGPFEVLSGKPDGWNPGFLVKAPDGRKFFFKFDQHELQPERMSMAEVVGSLIYHAVGFTVPCYEVLYFDRKSLVLGKGATVKNMKGEKVPMTEAFIDEAFKLVKIAADGKVRAVSSLLLEGKPLGPWTYAGTADDDPNDVIPHENRREVRAGYVLASWISHFDTRDQNTLRTWMTDKGAKEGYVRHNILDFGDSLGNLSDLDVISRRLGYSYYFDFPYLVGDFATLGVIERPWEKVQYGPGGPVLGYFDVDHFEPDQWHPGYPNPAFARMTEADAAWMARILAEFRDEHIDAMVARGKIVDATVREQLRETLIGRRDKLLRRWFQNLSPLSHPEARTTEAGGEVCVKDLALYSGVMGNLQRTYEAKTLSAEGELLNESAEMFRQANRAKTTKRRLANETDSPSSQVCVKLPAKSPDYLVVEILGKSTLYKTEGPLRVHVYREGASWRVAGLERPTLSQAK